MGFFDRILSALFGAGAAGDDAEFMHFRVRCSMCGEELHGRINLKYDLSLRDDAEGYLVRKTLVGSQRCFNRVETTLYFDSGRRLIDREIHGGEFVEEEADQPQDV